MPSPKTHYAKRGEINIAYQVVGDGAVDIVLVNGLVAHLDLLWLEPEGTAMVNRLATFARVIAFDKPGTGLSDPVAGAPTIEERMEDIHAVMDAVGSERAFLIGYSEGGFPAAAFAATYAERVLGLILLSTGARCAQEFDPDYGFKADLERMWRDFDELAIKRWGEGEFALLLAPSWRRSEAHRRLVPIFERASASPGMVKAIINGMRSYDIRSILPTIRVPTLVLHARDEWMPPEFGRDLANRIPGARFVELPGPDHIPFARDWRPLVAEIEAFVTGERRDHEPDRVLQTILFTDIAASTERAAQIGDRRWRGLLEQHDRIVDEQIARYGGRRIKALGDGHLAAFAGAAKAVRCARAICEEVRDLGIEVRAGVHTGECELREGDLGGLAVHIGARVAALARSSEVAVSGTVCDLVVGSGIQFEDRGVHELKGVPGRWHIYAATADEPAGARVVAHVDHAAASLTPAARETMKPIDKLAVTMARHAPALPRLGLRLSRRAGRVGSSSDRDAAALG